MKKITTICLLIILPFITYSQEITELETYEENGKIGILDENGKKITKAKYDKYWYDSEDNLIGKFTANFYEGLCSTSLDKKIGFINKKGQEVIPFQFSKVNEFTVEGLAAVEKNNKWGYINKKGKEITSFIFDKAFDFENGKALVIKEKSIYYINVKGEEYDSDAYTKYTLVGDYSETNLSIIQNSMQQIGFINKDKIYPTFYDEIFFSKADFFLVKLNNKFGIINRKAKEIVPPIYNEFSSNDAKYFYFWKNHKKGIIDIEGKIISPFIYGSISPFKEGLSRVKLDLVFVPDKTKNEDERYGFIDETGKEVIPRIYEYATDFENGRSKVKIGDDEFYINKKGERIQ